MYLNTKTKKAKVSVLRYYSNFFFSQSGIPTFDVSSVLTSSTTQQTTTNNKNYVRTEIHHNHLSGQHTNITIHTVKDNIMAKHLHMSYLWMMIHVLRIIIVFSQQSTSITGFSATIQTKTHYDKASRISTRSRLSSLSAREMTRRKSPRNQRKGRATTTRILQSSNNNNAYGRGAEIWPPPSEDEMLLENSFPNGILPDEVVETLQSLSLPERAMDNNAGLLPTRRKGLLLRSRKIPRALGRILRRAASAQEETEAEFGTNASSIIMDKTPMFMAAALILSGMVRPLDALLVSFLTGYFVILFLWARSLRRDGLTPVMPSLPPQGHVPHLVSNPLGAALTTYSPAYEMWLRVGAVLGLLAPVTLTLRYAVFTNQMDCARACARPLFFVCCQAISEAVSRRFLVGTLLLNGLLQMGWCDYLFTTMHV